MHKPALTGHFSSWLKNFVNNAPSSILLIDDQGVICLANQSAATLLHASCEALAGVNIDSLLSNDSTIICKRIISSASDTQAPAVLLKFNIDHGEKLTVRTSMLPVSESEPAGFIVMLEHAPQHTSSDANEHAEQIKSAIVDACLDTLVTINMNDEIVEFSAAGEAMFGWRREEVLGKRMADILIPAAMRDGHHRGMAHYRATGEGPLLGRLVQVEALHRDGHTLPVELGLVPINLPNEPLVTAFLRDISERKRTESALIEQKTKAEAASLAKSRFLSHMSHEIRTPLNALLGAMTLLQQQLNTETQHYYCEIAKSSGHTMLSIINQVLDFSKIEAGHVEINNEDTDILNLVNNVMLVTNSKLTSGVDLTNFTAPSVPDWLNIDALKLQQVITILLDNAVKFTKKGMIQLLLDWHPAENFNSSAQGQLIIDVIDTGIGIDPAHQTQIFAEFEQVDAIRDTSFGGTGLGLAIAKKLTRLMSGQLQLTSELGEGSHFRICLPATVTSASSLPKLSNLAHPVLVFSENPALLRFITDSLAAFELPEKRLHCADNLTTLQQLAGLLTEPCYCLFDASTAHLESLVFATPPARLIMIGNNVTIPEHIKAPSQTLSLPLTSTKLINSLHNKPIIQRRAVSQAPTELNAKLLLVEDIDVNRLLARTMLENHGFTVTEACDGVDALEKLALSNFDLILMDMRMPRLNGLDTTLAIRKKQGKNASIPIVALTANAESGEIERYIAAGINAFISKPFQINQLISTIEQLLTAKTAK